jgi:hypothetical protein
VIGRNFRAVSATSRAGSDALHPTAAVDALELGDEPHGHVRRGAGDRGRRVQCVGDVEGRGVGRERGLHVGRQVPQVRQLQPERFGVGAQVRRERGEGREQAVDREGVLLDVLGTAGQGLGGGPVGHLVRAPGSAAGEHPSGQPRAVGAGEGLGGGADQPVHREGHALRVGGREVEQDRPSIGAGWQRADEVAGEHDLAGAPGHDAADRLGHVGGVGALVDAPGTQRDGDVRPDVGDRDRGPGEGQGLRAERGVDRGQPGLAATPTEDHPGHDEHALVGGVVGEGERPERDEPRTAQLHRVVDDGGLDDAAPESRGVTHPVGAGEREPERLTDADDAVAVPDEGEGTVAERVAEDGARVVEDPGRDRQRGRRRGGSGHGSDATRRSRTPGWLRVR